MRPWAVASAWMWVAAGCDDAPPEPGHELPRAACVIAAVNSDFASTSVSLLAADGRPCATDLLHSGSRPPGLLTALSGDAVLPTGPIDAAAATLLVIDRYPNGVVTVLDAAAAAGNEVVAQLAVAPGFTGNPQDALALDDGTVLVSRLQPNPAPSAALDDYDEGGDLLVVDLAAGRALGRVDLAGAAQAGLEAMPTILARAGGAVWVGLAHQDAAFGQVGPGRVAVVDAAARALTATVELPAFSNCARLAAAARGLWVVCSGAFNAADPTAQVARSGLAYVDATTRAVAWSAGASQLAGAPLGLFSLGVLDDDRALVVAVGDLAAGTDDRLLLVDRRAGATTATTLLTAPTFQLGSILPSPAGGVVLVAIADREDPRVARLGLADLQPREPLRGLSATGLPTTQLALFR